MHNEELHKLYSPNAIKVVTSRRNGLGRDCSIHERDENANDILIGKPEMKRTLWRHVHRCLNNVISYLKGAVRFCTGVIWLGVRSIGKLICTL
jgi:hypothetical protein